MSARGDGSGPELGGAAAGCLLAEATVEKHGSHQSAKKRECVVAEENHEHALLPASSIFSRGMTKIQVGIKYVETLFLGDGEARAKMERRPTGARLNLVYRLILTS